MDDDLLMTRADYEKLQGEIEELETSARGEMAERIKAARELGDLKENAEYHDAKDAQAILETKILRLRDQLTRAQVVEAEAGGDAVGFGDVPPDVFTAALDLVEEGGWIAFTIKEDFLDDADESGFAALIAGMLRSGAIEERDRRRYQHRLDVNGDPIHYVAIAGIKR